MSRRTALDRKSRLLLAIITPIYRVWMSTLRVRFLAPSNTRKHIESGEAAIFALWHEGLACTLWVCRRRGLIAMVSRHRDGELVTRLAQKFGFGAERGSSTRGGSSALRGMIERAKEGHPLAITPDGPKGPRRVAQAGALEIARRSGVPIIPVLPIAERAHRFRSWDRMALPWPWARTLLLYDEPLALKPESDTDEALTELQKRLDSLSERAEANLVELWREGSRRTPHPRRPVPRLEGELERR